MKGILAVLLAMSVIVLGYLLWSAVPSERESTAVRVDDVQIIDPTEDDRSDLLSLAPAESAATRDAALHAGTPPADDVPLAAEDTPLVSPLVIEGTLLIRRLDGTEQSDADGEIHLVVWETTSGHAEVVEVVGGKFRAELHSGVPGDRVTLRSLMVDGRPMRVIEPTGDLPLETSIQLIAQELAPQILEVMAKGTGGHLSSVRLVTAPSFPEDSVVIPMGLGKRSLVATNLQSPIDLGPYIKTSWEYDLLVGVDGYEWARIPVRPLIGGLQRIELELAGSLNIDVSQVDPKAAAHLRLRREGASGPIVDQKLVKDAPVALTGLRPGTYQVSAEVGDHWNSPIILGAAVAEVSAGLVSQVSLLLEAAPTFQKATMEGQVYIARGWGVSRPRVLFDLLDTPLNGFDDHKSMGATKSESDRAGFDAYSFRTENMQVGRYSVGIFDPQVAVGVDLPAEGATDIEIVVGPPVKLLVYIVEKGTGYKLEVDKLAFNVKRPEGTSGGGLKHASFDATRGAYVIKAPESIVELMYWTWTHIPYRGEVDLTQGIREHRIELERAAGFELSMVDEHDTLVPFPEDWMPEISHVDGEGHRTLSSGGHESAKALVSEPGTYTVTLPVIPGFADPGLQELVILPGEILKSQIVLHRSD